MRNYYTLRRRAGEKKVDLVKAFEVRRLVEFFAQKFENKFLLKVVGEKRERGETNGIVNRKRRRLILISLWVEKKD